ncbi:DHH family phosphoesterase [Clostridium fungisolvens]|uniref:Bifunctional oligoribonuclease and PAP phosphatase NrnA n=1 Tax=Clostridium fungisolvens TaxID=1604897 RepID=A0A6V8SGS8_9CLOT|nr:bifunctional oligoribonuclease/PAP phosphatase NrnA [Clostridium fungisolvens]GFP75926.1 Bifunctional oligoribonuclease and PAP phosphatase NrnA [Clostridium fungisolvens]
MTLHEIANKILPMNKIGITFHVSPDGDAAGSVLSLYQALKKIGKEAYMISKDTISYNLSFLPFSNELNGECVSPKEDSDCVIILDCGNKERISADLEGFKGTIINIDHHLSNDLYGDLNFIDVTASATAEIVYSLINLLNAEMDSDIAKCLYTALVTDTGSFRHSNATPTTHNIASELLKFDINHSDIHSNIFDNKPFEKLKLIGYVLGNTELIYEGKLAVMEITKDTVSRLNIVLDDSSDIISQGLQIRGVEGAVLFREVEDGVKVSLRSKKYLNVNKVASVFGGGGHIRASGITMKNISLNEAKNLVLNQIKEEI